MSADEFDPMIERLFERSTPMADAALFAADVETRLSSSSRVRTLALTLAGVVGGVIAVREAVHMNLSLGDAQSSVAQSPVAGRAIGQGLQAASLDVQGAVASAMAQMGLTDMALGSLGGMQLFWVAAGALIVLAAAGAMKMSEEV